MMEIDKIWKGWKIDRYLGSGAFGKVYKIIREEFGHTYEAALKIISIPQNQSEVDSIMSEGIDEDGITQYFYKMVEDIVKEVQLMSELKGISNIVSYEEHAIVQRENEVGWDIYIRMELLTPLLTYLKQTSKLSRRQIIQLGIDICTALEVCQKRNIIHRDIKPENIFVSKDGLFELGDFGIARQLEKTTSGLSKKGTYTYMAPEIYKGQPYNSTVDIYSLGIVMYRFLNKNRAPFLPEYPKKIFPEDRENANVLRMSGTELPKPCEAEGRLSEIILKACAYNPKDRYESAAEMKRALLSIEYTETEGNVIYPDGDTLTYGENSYMKSIGQESTENNTYVDNDVTVSASFFACNKKNTGVDKKKEENNNEDLSNEKFESESTISGVSVNRDEKDNGERDNIKNKNGKWKLFIPIAIGIACVCIFAGKLSYQKQQLTTVPDTVNKTVEEARDLLQKSKLSVIEEEPVYSDTVKKGYIVSQDIEKGTEVLKNSSVKIIVSKGDMPVIPELVNTNTDVAKQALQAVNMQLEVKQEYSDKVAAGLIIDQQPESGTKAEEGTVVLVTVSKGVEMIKVPSVKGKSLKDAEKTIEAVNLKIKTKKAYSDSVSKGNVIKQSIDAGKQVKKGTVVTLTISKGKKPEEKETTSTNQNTGNASSNNSSTNSNVNSGTSNSNNKAENKKEVESDDSLDSWTLVN